MRNRRGTFGQTLMTATIVGTVFLIAMMIIGINHFSKKDVAVNPNQLVSIGTSTEESVDQTQESTALVVIKEINNDEIYAFNIGNNRNINKKITDTTTIKNAEGKSMPRTSLNEGDIVQISYVPTHSEIIAINKVTDTWKSSRVNGIKIDEVNKRIHVGAKTYRFDDNIYVHSKDEVIKVNNTLDIKKGDIVTLQGLKDQVYSIIVEEAAASIKVVDLPTTDGMLEIDRNTMIPLSQVNGSIEVTPGIHRIVVEMKGYETLIDQIELISGEAYQYSVKDAKEAYCNITVKTNNPDIDYTVQIGDKTFSKGEEIKVIQDTYDITITAENYEPWSKRVKLSMSKCILQVNLAQIESEEETESEAEEEITDSEEKNVIENAYTINIATEPVGAKVYIDGVQKGTTPYKVTLPVGSYTILLEKKGYEIYTTSIILDNSSDQSNFLYVLTPEE